MNPFEWQAREIEFTAGMMAHFVKQTPADRLDWKPEADPGGQGRSVLDQVRECVGIYRMVAAVLSGGAPTQDVPDIADADTAERELKESARAYADAVRAQSPEMLTQTYDIGFGQVPGSFVITMPARNMMYHVGQICYIQTLYGDMDFEVPQNG